MRPRDLIAVALAFGMSGILLWLVFGTSIADLNALVATVLLFLTFIAGTWIVRDAERQAFISKYWVVFLLLGLLIAALAICVAISTGRTSEMPPRGFGPCAAAFIIGLGIAFLPRWCWWEKRLAARRGRRG